jgi:hypothetical protein
LVVAPQTWYCTIGGVNGPGVKIAVKEPVIGVNVPWLPPGVISVNTTDAGVTPETVISVWQPTLVITSAGATAPTIEINVNTLALLPGLQNVNVWKIPPGKQMVLPLMGTLLQSTLQSCGEGAAPSISIVTPTASGCNRTLNATQFLGLVAPQHNPSLTIGGVTIVCTGAVNVIGINGTFD